MRLDVEWVWIGPGFEDLHASLTCIDLCDALGQVKLAPSSRRWTNFGCVLGSYRSHFTMSPSTAPHTYLPVGIVNTCLLITSDPSPSILLQSWHVRHICPLHVYRQHPATEHTSYVNDLMATSCDTSFSTDFVNGFLAPPCDISSCRSHTFVNDHGSRTW